VAFFRKKTTAEPEARDVDLGFLVFQNTSEVLQAEKALRKAGWKDIRVMGPPPEVRTAATWSSNFPLWRS
jgi:hypothetical protein